MKLAILLILVVWIVGLTESVGEENWRPTICNMNASKASKACNNSEMCCGSNGLCSLTFETCSNSTCVKSNCWSVSESAERASRRELEFQCSIKSNDVVPVILTFDDGPHPFAKSFSELLFHSNANILQLQNAGYSLQEFWTV